MTSTMTKEQNEHCHKVAAAFVVAMGRKYEAGVREHGGNLWDKSARELVDEAINECIDQFVYLTTLREKL